MDFQVSGGPREVCCDSLIKNIMALALSPHAPGFKSGPSLHDFVHPPSVHMDGLQSDRAGFCSVTVRVCVGSAQITKGFIGTGDTEMHYCMMLFWF